tara:strand:+ start:3195 stop:4730 length:1536 start_codon:yes stop_codon:yes gene_type:complete
LHRTGLAIPAIRKTGIVVLVLFLALGGALVRKEYVSERSRAQVRVHTAAHVVATQFSWIFESSGQTLRRIEEAVVKENLRANSNSIIDINKAVRGLPSGSQYSVYDRQGELIYSSFADAVSISVDDRSYFDKLRSGQELVLSPMVQERLSGEKVFIIAKRLNVAGTFAGVATIAIPVTTLSYLANTLGFTAGSTISLIREDGMLIARSPPIEPVDLSDSRVFEMLKTNPDGFYESVSPADGVARIVGYHKLPDWPIVAIAGMNSATAMAGFWHVMLIWALLGLPILVGLYLAVMKLQNMMRIDEARQESLAIANQKNEFLLREIHHRIKNNLQTVTSLIRLQKLPNGAGDALVGRISAMASVHEEMYKSDQFESVEVSPYIKRLTSDIVTGYGKDVDITLDIAPVSLSGDRAMQLGLLVNELVANAFKHAFTDGDKGKLLVRLTETAEEELQLIVLDDGPGFEAETTSKNMGSVLIAAFAGQLGGTYEIHSNDGTRIEVRFPKTNGHESTE